MSHEAVTIVDGNRNVVATADVEFQEGYYSGSADVDRMPEPIRRLFDEYEEIVNDQIFSLLDQIEDQIGAIPFLVVFDDGRESRVTDLQGLPQGQHPLFQSGWSWRRRKWGGNVSLRTAKCDVSSLLPRRSRLATYQSARGSPSLSAFPPSPPGVIGTVSPTSYYGSWLALGLIAVVALLLGWQWAERRHRGAIDLPDDDRIYFRRQDVRRWVAAGALTLLAVGIHFGSRLPYKRDGRPNLAFVEVWLTDFALIFVLTGLALADWLATRAYARRQRSAIVREGMEILREEMRLRAAQASKEKESGGRNGFPPREG